ncbi:MAG: 4Fe-4S binding protein [Candidatus Acidulodesulfobacterium sp.]
MNILNLLDKFLNAKEDEGRILINPDFCVRLKTPMAGCYECIERCPDLSIKITDAEINILDNCSNCNACLYLCPNSVFYVKKDKNEAACDLEYKEGKKFYFCGKTEKYLKEFKIPVNDNNNFIKCIYELEDADIISSVKNGSEVIFVSSDCKSCRLKYFRNKKIKRINEIEKFLNKENAFKEIKAEDFNFKEKKSYNFKHAGGKAAEKYKETDKKNNENEGVVTTPETLDRREFFKNSFKSLKDNAKKLAENVSIEDLPLSELYSRFINTGKNERSANYLLLKRQKKIYKFLKENKDLVPIFNIRLPKINENCVLCSNCWEMCPTGALIFKENKILLEPFFCTSCGLCKDICSFGALRMYKASGIKDISGKKILFLNKNNF